MSSKIDSKNLCLNLRCKQMYYKVEDPEWEEHQKEVDRLFGPCDSTVYWCECTETGRGPDDQPVHKDQCCSPTRKCFEGVQFLT